MQQVDKLGCPRCGGSLGLNAGDRIVTCEFCGGRNLLVTDSRTTYYQILPVKTQAQAEVAAAEFLASAKGVSRDLIATARFDDAELYFMPFYQIRGIRIGTLRTRDYNTGYTGIKPASFSREPQTYAQLAGQVERQRRLRDQQAHTDTRVIQNDFEFSHLAASVTDWGVEYLNLSKRFGRKKNIDLVPFDQRMLQKMGTVIHPDMSETQFLDMYQNTRTTQVHQTTRIVNESVKLIYYPVWRVTFWYRKVPYQIVVDGVTGDRLFMRCPGSEDIRILVFLASMGFLAFTLAGLGSMAYRYSPSGEALSNMLGIMYMIWMIAGVFVIGIIAVAWVNLRYPMEYVHRGEYCSMEYIGKRGATLPERLFDLIRRGIENNLMGGS